LEGKEGIMTRRAGGFSVLIVSGVAVLLIGCSREKATQIKVLSEQEAADLWSRAESNQPVGKASSRKILGDTGVTVVTTQAYMLRMRGGGSNGIVTACGFSCIAPAGTSPKDCQTSGCEPSGNTCTPASCGSCIPSQPCKAESNWGVFGGIFIARLDRGSGAPPVSGLRVVSNTRR
jgi:hypothetical protein